MIGRHLLLSPVSTAVKPTHAVFAHHPNPIQEGELSRIVSRRHAWSVEEHRCNLCIVHFSEIVGLINCKSVCGSAIWPNVALCLG